MSTMHSRLAAFAMPALFVALPVILVPSAAPGQGRRPDLSTGKQLFDASCSSCHGLDASGGQGPNIQRIPASLGDEATAKIIKGGVPGTGMPAFAGLTDAQAMQIVAHIRTLGNTAMGNLATGDPEKGKGVYEANECAHCHTVNGVGGDLGPDLTAIGRLRPPDFMRLELQNPGGNLPKSPVTGIAIGKWTEYLIFRAVTKDRHVVEGMRTAESTLEIVLEDANGNFHSLHKADLQSLEKEPGKSFMPSQASLSNVDLNNLAAYLASLKGAQ
ncbi:MAG TPA: c-type cytochrome [Candidatus Acidoferrales bacterium]